MTDWKTIRPVIAEKIKEIQNIGRVHEFLRHTTFWEDYFKRHKQDGRILDWEITRLSVEQELIAVQNVSGTEPFFHDDHLAVIIGRMALKDANETEKEFQDLIDSIVVKFRQNNRLNQIAIIPQQPQVPVIGHRTFGGVLVHYTEITFPVRVRVGG